MPSSRPARWPAWSARVLLLFAATAAFVVAWVVLAWSTGSQSSWMALLAALDVAWVLRLGGWPSSPHRAIAGMVATAVAVAAANWWIIAVNVGAPLGFDPWDSSLRLGLRHAWFLAGMANGLLDLALYAVAVLLAGWMSR